jgi:hypothetical protein
MLRVLSLVVVFMIFLGTISAEAARVPHPQNVLSKRPGYRVADVDEYAVFDTLGLEEGDVIKQIGTVTLDSSISAKKVAYLLNQTALVDLVVERHGREEVLHYHIR